MERIRSALIADGDKDVCELIRKSVESLGTYRKIFLSNDGTDAHRKFHNQPFDLLILDLQIPKMDALTLLKSIVELKKTYSTDKIVIVAKEVVQEHILQLKKWNIKNIILKPFTEDALTTKLKEITKNHK